MKKIEHLSITWPDFTDTMAHGVLSNSLHIGLPPPGYDPGTMNAYNFLGLGLFVACPPQRRNLLLADVVEATYNGYAQASNQLIGLGAGKRDAAGRWYAALDPVDFVATAPSPPQTIKGVFGLALDGITLLFAREFREPFAINPARPLTLALVFSFEPDFPR